jgi:hypothetical protein
MHAHGYAPLCTQIKTTFFEGEKSALSFSCYVTALNSDVVRHHKLHSRWKLFGSIFVRNFFFAATL